MSNSTPKLPLPEFSLPEPPQHDPRMVEVLHRHGFNVEDVPVSLEPRYTKGRRWTPQELEDVFEAWERGETFHSISARFNRNPQDIIFKLIDVCKNRGQEFTESGRSAGTKHWTKESEACARELFELGLPAWKIAIVFNVDFEHAEKRLFIGRDDYGHKKFNPFQICTDHKRDLNLKVLQQLNFAGKRMFDGFAGRGLATIRYSNLLDSADITAIESDGDTYETLKDAVSDYPRVNAVHDECRRALLRAILDGDEKYDLIDLDPFVTCYDAIQPALEMLKPGGLLFLTFGGEYRRCFIESNRKTLAKRYRMHLFGLENSTTFAEAPRYMLGEVAEQAFTLGKIIEPLVLVRYPMVVRAYLRVDEPRSVSELLLRFRKQVTRGERGSRFETGIPKWKLISLERPMEDFASHSHNQDDHHPRRR